MCLMGLPGKLRDFWAFSISKCVIKGDGFLSYEKKYCLVIHVDD